MVIHIGGLSSTQGADVANGVLYGRRSKDGISKRNYVGKDGGLVLHFLAMEAVTNDFRKQRKLWLGAGDMLVLYFLLLCHPFS